MKYKNSSCQLTAFPINLIRKVDDDSETLSEVSESSTLAEKVQKIHMQPIKDLRGRTNKYVLQFHVDSPKEVRELKEKARQRLEELSEEALEVGGDYFDNFDLPKRPSWSFTMKKEVVLANEERQFFKYVTALEKAHYDDMRHLSVFELNLETWRQLWRVLELSDILIIIADIRFPSLLFPPYLFEYITKDLKKDVILLLNKIDLVDTTVVLAWKKYFEEKYKSIHVILFTSYPSYNLRGSTENKHGLKIRRRKGRMKMALEGALEVYKTCSSIVKNQVDLSKWHDKIQAEMTIGASDDDNEDENDEVEVESMHVEEKDFDFEEHEQYNNGILTIGTIGFPNVGKSSVLNALMGKKVVSISRTPGHTKHFQTIFLTSNVRLVDCPGLVFPSSVPKTLQILLGSFPISQLREPYATVKYLAERVDLQKMLDLKHPEGKNEVWSAIDICDALAIKRGFLTAKTGRPDSYRAANSILRMALDGKITLSLKPIGYTKQKNFWESHDELKKVKEIQALGRVVVNDYVDDDYMSDSDNENAQRPSDYLPKHEKKKSKKSDIGDDGDGDDEDTDCDTRAATSNPFDALINEHDDDDDD